jgi:MFS family permease
MNNRAVYPSYRWLILLVQVIATISFSIDLIGYAPILEEITKELKVDMGAATHLMMGFVLTSAIALTCAGAVCDKYGITFVLILGLLCASVPATFMPWIGHSYKIVFLSRLIQGASAGFIGTTMGPILALWFPLKERVLASGFMAGALSLGSTIGVAASPVVFLAVASWQKTVAILSIPGWIGILLAFMITKKPPSSQAISGLTEVTKPEGGGITFRQALSFPITWIGPFIMFFASWNLQCLYNLVPTYLAAETPVGVGFGPIMSGKLSLALTIVGIFATLTGGVFYDKVVKRN